ncbi:hypothetical protein ACQPWR_20585 [Micromonospora vinacea]|uniref:hypothetical protein n=1 Tax=Micromonospora vinacea TaxID=709878 RepID=UPI003D8BFB00
MSKVLAALSVSVDGYITGRDPGPRRGLGDGGMLFDWYFDGDTPSAVFDGFRLSATSARVFDTAAARVGASLAGRNTYDDSGWGSGGTPHPDAPLVVLSHRPLPAEHSHQTLVTSGIDEAVDTAPGAARRHRRARMTADPPVTGRLEICGTAPSMGVVETSVKKRRGSRTPPAESCSDPRTPPQAPGGTRPR